MPSAVSPAAANDPGGTRPRAGHGRPRVALPVLLFGLAIVYVLPSVMPGLLRQVGIESPLPGPAATIPWNWLAVGVLLLYVFRVEGLGWASLRLVRPTEKDLTWAGWLGGALMVWHWGVSVLLPAGLKEQTDQAEGAFVALGPVLALALVLTAGITEEVLYRGYAVERVAAWAGPWIASILGLALFAASHVPFFGAGWLLTVLPSAAMFYVMLAWRRNLWACILMHVLGNSPVVVLAVLAQL